MTIRIINGCNKWGKERGLINSYQRIKGGSDYDPRERVLSDAELKILFDGVTPYHFNQFVTNNKVSQSDGYKFPLYLIIPSSDLKKAVAVRYNKLSINPINDTDTRNNIIFYK